MNDTPQAILMTTEEFLALPADEDVERDLIRGQLREEPMTRHNPRHSGTEVNLGYLLKSWLKQRPPPRGRLFSGEAGFRLARDPDTTVGIDVAYISAELASRTPEDAKIVDGAPILAVEILSPSDKQEKIIEKIRGFLQAGVARVWIVDPAFRTVCVYRPDAEPELFNVRQELTAEPHLPGLRVPVAEIFEA